MAFKYGVAALALMLSGSVFAAVTLSAPEEIVVLAVNDQEVNSGLIRKKNEYKVDAGQVAVSVRYQQYFEHLNGEHDILKSGVVTVTAPDLKDGQTYKIALVNPPQRFEDAKKYSEQPTIAIYDNKNRLVVQQTGVNTEAKPWLGSGLFGKVIDLTSSKKAPVNQPAAVYATTTSQSPAATTVTKTTQALSDANSADRQLIQIWQNASKAERQKFMTWLAEQ
ncbi:MULTISPECIES: DUF2057 domain-containing protein [unclassified Acinetobacter]|uniref:YccT family protein n=1 Tax=unclassified Acinetobacter TaxID=196816 RepID=UPI0030170F48